MTNHANPRTGALVDRLRLVLVPGVGPRTRRLLLEHFGSAAAVFEAAPQDLRNVPGVGPRLTRRILAASDRDVAAEIEICRQHGITILTDDDADFPRLLQEIPDPPGALFVRGDLVPADALAVGVVGTRQASHYGRKQAARLAAELARAGLTVVSGLARGIDAAAHRGALAAGGRTIAVLGSGLLNVYPPEHVALASEVASCGAVISELPPRQQPMSGTFPQRNRLISGLSLGLVVVEAAQRSGALISATHAMEQGREVFAVPGRVDQRTARGCHRLIRDGAKLVEHADDILEELGPLVEPATRGDGRVIRHPAELQLNEQEQAVLNAVQDGPTNIDEVIAASQLPVHRVLATISVLEMRRLIRRVGGQQIERA